MGSLSIEKIRRATSTTRTASRCRIAPKFYQCSRGFRLRLDKFSNGIQHGIGILSTWLHFGTAVTAMPPRGRTMFCRTRENWKYFCSTLLFLYTLQKRERLMTNIQFRDLGWMFCGVRGGSRTERQIRTTLLQFNCDSWYRWPHLRSDFWARLSVVGCLMSFSMQYLPLFFLQVCYGLFKLIYEQGCYDNADFVD